MRKWARVAAVIVLLFVVAMAVDTYLLFNGIIGSCIAPLYEVSVKGSGFAMDVSPPYFWVEQLVLHPGSSALVSANFTLTRGNFTTPRDLSQYFNSEPDGWLDVAASWGSGAYVPRSESGLSLSFVGFSMDLREPNRATVVYNVSASQSARGGTYSLFSSCRYDGPYVTTGSLPYVGTILDVPQPVTLLIPFVFACVASVALVAVVLLK